MLLGVAGGSGFGLPFCFRLVGFWGLAPASFRVGAGRVVWACVSAGSGRIIHASVSVGTRGIEPVSLSAGVLVPSSGPTSARSIKCPPMLLSFFSFSFPLDDGVGGGSILLISADGGGTGILWFVRGMPWSAGGVPRSAEQVTLSAGGIPWSAGGTDGESIRSALAFLRSSVAG